VRGVDVPCGEKRRRVLFETSGVRVFKGGMWVLNDILNEMSGASNESKMRRQSDRNHHLLVKLYIPSKRRSG
jgi:hypothetical protein